jgi:glutamine amidotransferase
MEAADGVLLPGVGAFGEGMRNLERDDLVGPLKDLALSGKALLGICLGMQLLMEESEEFGRWPGLGLLSGRVVQLKPRPGDGAKVPHIGWSSVHPADGGGAETWAGTLLDGVNPGAFAYFVHSYSVQSASDPLAETTYGGQRFCSVAVRGNVMGCQFHPERSAQVGLRVLQNWLDIAGR